MSASFDSSSLAEVKVVLADVAELTRAAYRHVELAMVRLADATAHLAELGRQHQEPLVPVGLIRAETELERGLQLLTTAAAAVADIDARL
ncbi:hypothetical protein [Pseudonocardia asaccharolytica]|uniref:Uncharacterized protein n=1 Tax=Pseudonocardia asaccharolytica DSM 44247 = NBRC 16224 TaxID=1123024 RepID=A0A511D0F4_9PSEU|nr:hypothetical protein [Pseudonocardia asaccharolytica]GEL18271.1 hypothetical protein PA7_21080 [Pseudonocardia asaccharolytica DSM 44247 = NBRC 16224]